MPTYFFRNQNTNSVKKVLLLLGSRMSYLVKHLGFRKKYLCWEVNFTVNSTIQLLLQSCWTDFAKTVT